MNKIGYLVKITSVSGNKRNLDGIFVDELNDEISNSFINKIGVISYIHKFEDFNQYVVFIKHRYTRIFYEDEFEILYDEPVHNHFFLLCFWCNEMTKYDIIFKDRRIYYCPKCLR